MLKLIHQDDATLFPVENAESNTLPPVIPKKERVQIQSVHSVAHSVELDDFSLDSLNAAQRSGVESFAGPVLIIAGAGSGKTRVLTYRIAHLLKKGIQSYNVLALTFTNKAAQEMKERIIHLVGTQAGERLWAGTFHSIFARILRIEAASIGFTSSFTIYDGDDQLSAIRAVMTELGLSQQMYPPQGMRARISKAKNDMFTSDQFSMQAGNLTDKQTALVFQGYEKRLKLSNAMDFDDILTNIIHLFKRNPDVLERWQDRFHYLLVDEYQDTNRAQYLAIKLLAQKRKNVCVVGDDAQSIYRWRGADIRNILDFQKDYPEATVVRLEQNYRSTKNIITAADWVIKNNRRQLPKELWTENEEGEKITVMQCENDREEAERIAQSIKHELYEQTELSYRDVAILYRTNAQSQAIEDALRRSQVAYSIISGLSFYKRKEVKDTICYLRLIVNPSDTEALLRVINEPPRGIGATTIGRLQEFARNNSLSLFSAFKRVEEITEVQRRFKDAIKNFVEVVEHYSRKRDSDSAAGLAREFLSQTGYERMYRETGTTESEDRLLNIERVLATVDEFTERNIEGTLEQFLQEISLMSDGDDADTSLNKVSLMTMHAAKGLEFQIVFIAGMEQGLFPFERSTPQQEELEEERRLFYVGITRARKKLYLTLAQRRFRFGEITFSRPSEFITEIADDLLVWKDISGIRSKSHTPTGKASGGNTPFATRPISPEKKPWQSSYASLSSKQSSTSRDSSKPSASKPFFDDIPQEEDSHSQIPEQEVEITMGARVVHPHFGEGKVMTVSGSGDQRKAVVHFRSVGSKTLLLKFAKLRVLS